MIEPFYMLLVQLGSILGFLAAMAMCVAFFLVWRVTRDIAYLLLAGGMLLQWLVAGSQLFWMMIMENALTAGAMDHSYNMVMFMAVPFLQWLSSFLLLIGGILLAIRAVKVFRSRNLAPAKRTAEDPIERADHD